MKSLTAISGRIASAFIALTLCLFVAVPAERAEAAGESLQVASVATAATASSEVGASLGVAEADSTVSYAGVGLEMRGKIHTAGWGDWVGAGVEFGDRFTGLDMRALQIKLVAPEGVQGSIAYQTYKHKGGWQPWASSGSPTNVVRNMESIKVKLVGAVSRHYDVLYRVYVSGAGWQPWAKNGEPAGLVGGKQNIQAAQVKLSPKTTQALRNPTSDVGIHYEVRSSSSGWQAWKRNGKTAGSAKSNRALNGLSMRLDAGDVAGGVKYRVFTTSAVWEDWASDGSTIGTTSQRIEGVKIKLTGKVAKRYDVYYRAYAKSVGWLGWAKNGQTAGSTFRATNLNGLQVKLVEKGAAAPGETRFRTINELESTATLDGIDIASWQAGINIYNADADFVIVKSTQGDWYINPYFREHADATLKSGKLLGIYHFADLRGNATQQADYFIESVRPYRGKAMLFLDFEADITTIPDAVPWVETFMARVHSKTGVKPLIYLSQSLTKEKDWSNVASKYELWVAQYLYKNFYTGYLDAPDGGTDLGYWRSPRIYQYSSTGSIGGYGERLDINKFYGSARTWRELAAVR